VESRRDIVGGIVEIGPQGFAAEIIGLVLGQPVETGGRRRLNSSDLKRMACSWLLMIPFQPRKYWEAGLGEVFGLPHQVDAQLADVGSGGRRGSIRFSGIGIVRRYWGLFPGLGCPAPDWTPKANTRIMTAMKRRIDAWEPPFQRSLMSILPQFEVLQAQQAPGALL